MADSHDDFTGEYNLEDWERALTIHVGTPYACRRCGNLVMVTRGGVGVLELACCGEPMERIERDADPSDGGRT